MQMKNVVVPIAGRTGGRFRGRSLRKSARAVPGTGAAVADADVFLISFGGYFRTLRCAPTVVKKVKKGNPGRQVAL